MAKIPTTKIRDRILKERSIATFQPAPRKHRRIKPIIKVASSSEPKTAKMLYLELRYNCRIEEILLSGSLSVVARKLGGEVDTSTISKWIKKLRLRYTKDNLPNCQYCRHKKTACIYGICYVLVEMELWDLVLLKKEEIVNG